MNNDTRWVNFFDAHLKKYHSLIEYAAAHWQFHAPLFYHVKKIVPAPAKLLEIGCGFGLSAIYLHGCGYEVTAIDSAPEIVTQAEAAAHYFDSAIRIQCADAFALSEYYGKFDLAYSLGVLEHFDRAVTIQLLREQAKCARYVVIGVPSRFTFPITDERIYTIFQITSLVKEAGFIPIKAFGYGDPPQLLSLKRLLPHALYRLLQNVGSLAQELVVIGEKK